jgi:hypothetical protein
MSCEVPPFEAILVVSDSFQFPKLEVQSFEYYSNFGNSTFPEATNMASKEDSPQLMHCYPNVERTTHDFNNSKATIIFFKVWNGLLTRFGSHS